MTLQIKDMKLDEERALYGTKDAVIENCLFDGPADGESAIKECQNIEVLNSKFNLRYPFWHVTGAKIRDCETTENCRAALWYDKNIVISNCVMNGIKAVRECENVELDNCKIVSPEFGWKCHDLKIHECDLTGEYPFLDTKRMDLEQFTLHGKYSFQYVENVEIRNSDLQTKDAFWHSKNVTVYDSVVNGEYLGWYSENLHLIRCSIKGTQPLCYCKGLVLEDCTMEDCDLSFENSEVKATVKGSIDSVKNPICGYVRADKIGEIILDQPTSCKIEG